MDRVTLTGTGLSVSRIGLGCMGFGSTSWNEWVLEEPEATEVIDRALELGIDFFDTANVYSKGESERIVGNALEGHLDRCVLATKVYNRMDDANPHSGGLSRKAIEQELSASRDRLGVETIDLYQIHRWDDRTPIEETLRTLDDAVRRGEVRYLGASSMWAHQFARALWTSDRLGLERFVTMQNHYNLVYREEEREMLPFCDREGVGVLPWSPLAKGYLTRPHEELEATSRGEHDDYLHTHPYREGAGPEINARVEQLAEERGVSMAQIALAWLLHKEWVDAPIVGCRTVEHLEDAVEATEISLTGSDLEYLEEPYDPVRVSGHR